MERTSFVQRTLKVGVLLLALVWAGAQAAVAGTLSGVVNVNAASAEQLTLLPGVGESRAAAIIALREGRTLETAEELLEVKGIGEKILERLRPFISFEGESTLAVVEEEETSAAADGDASAEADGEAEADADAEADASAEADADAEATAEAGQ